MHLISAQLADVSGESRFAINHGIVERLGSAISTPVLGRMFLRSPLGNPFAMLACASEVAGRICTGCAKKD